jgi:hypothetical protein
VPDSNVEQMTRELANLLNAARDGQLPASVFAARLEWLHARFLGEDANAPEMVKRRHDASIAHERLASDIDRHHHLELLAQTLGVDLPQAP